MKWTVFLLLGLCALAFADIDDDIEIPDDISLDDITDEDYELLKKLEAEQSVRV